MGPLDTLRFRFLLRMPILILLRFPLPKRLPLPSSQGCEFLRRLS